MRTPTRTSLAGRRGRSADPKDFQKLAEPWQGAVEVTVEPGKTARGVVVDFRPPGPLVEPTSKAATAAR